MIKLVWMMGFIFVHIFTTNFKRYNSNKLVRPCSNKLSIYFSFNWHHIGVYKNETSLFLSIHTLPLSSHLYSSTMELWAGGMAFRFCLAKLLNTARHCTYKFSIIINLFVSFPKSNENVEVDW